VGVRGGDECIIWLSNITAILSRLLYMFARTVFCHDILNQRPLSWVFIKKGMVRNFAPRQILSIGANVARHNFFLYVGSKLRFKKLPSGEGNHSSLESDEISTISWKQNVLLLSTFWPFFCSVHVPLFQESFVLVAAQSVRIFSENTDLAYFCHRSNNSTHNDVIEF
jgi:hypothetical protein